MIGVTPSLRILTAPCGSVWGCTSASMRMPTWRSPLSSNFEEGSPLLARCWLAAANPLTVHPFHQLAFLRFQHEVEDRVVHCLVGGAGEAPVFRLPPSDHCVPAV